jgi:hypothetical protein
MSEETMGTPYAQAKCATPLAPVADEYGITITEALRKRSAIFSSGTYPVNSIFELSYFLASDAM